MNSSKQIFLFLVIITTLSACTFPPTSGTLQRSGEITILFEDDQLPEDYRYYFYGPDVEPSAILGIAPEFTLESRYWKVIIMDEKIMKEWNRSIDNSNRVKLQYFGFELLNPEGKKAGIYYSKWDWTVIDFPAPGKIVVWAPDPTSIQKQPNGNILIRNK